MKRVALGAAIGAAGCLPEIGLRFGGDPLTGVALALTLGGAGGAFLALVVDLAGERRSLAAALLLLPIPILQAVAIHSAIGRIADLSLVAGSVAVWLAALTVAAALAVIAYRALGRSSRSLMNARRIRAAITAGVLILAAALCLELFQGKAPLTAKVVMHVVAVAALALAVSTWRRRIVLPALAVASFAALCTIPDRYTGLAAAAGFLALGAAVLSVEAMGWAPPHGPLRPGRIAACLGVVALLLLASHLLVARSPGSWRTATGGGLLSVLVRAGHAATDFDGDGHGAIFAQHDCAPFDRDAFPGGHEIPGNDVDENCLAGPEGGDACGWVRAREARNPRPKPWRGDVILVLVDTLRYRDADGVDVPNLRVIAASGVRFTRAYSTAPFTAFALLGMLAGRLAPNTTTTWFGMLSGVSKMPQESLVPLLARAGYSTAVVGGATPGENAYFRRDTYGRGFGLAHLMPMSAPPEEVARAAADAWRTMGSGRPRFLYVHLMWLHEPRDGEGERVEALRRLDAALGQMRSGLGDDALWIVASDHGEERGEHGGRYHASTLYDEQVHVPLIVTRPDLAPRRETSVSTLRSLYPTLAAMVAPDVSPPGNGPYLCLDGVACADLPVPMALEMQTIHLHGLVVGSRKVVRDIDHGAVTAFDLDRDPGEQRPLSPVPAKLEAALVSWEEHLFGPRDDACFWPYDGGKEPAAIPLPSSQESEAATEEKRDAGAADASPDGGSGERGGVLCVAPLDYSETPGKGAMTVEGFGDGPSPTPRNARAIVKVNGEKQEITLKKGARFDGLPLNGHVVVSLASPGQRPYFSRKISFEKEGANALCLYENPFYATVQISDVPRRPFCRKCMKDDAQ